MSEPGDVVKLGLWHRAAAHASSSETARALAVERDERQKTGTDASRHTSASVPVSSYAKDATQ